MRHLVELAQTPSFRLDGKRALVSGASRGIGAACAAALAAAGAHVTLLARSGAEIEAIADALMVRGDSADALALDMTDIAATKAALDDRAAYDILVNNAGTTRAKPAIEMLPDDLDAVFDLNVRALYFMTQTVAKRLIASGKPGSIISMSSQMGHVGGPKRSVYSASKFAVEGMTRAMAIEFGPHGIRVNTICPTFIETELTAKALSDPEFRDWVLSKIKLGRIGRVEDIMGPVVFLASDAAALITGSSIMVDGGWTAE